MAQTYTLDEAAQKLGIPQDELKRRLRDDWKHVRSFRDGSTLRFRAADIDELARTLGAGSDPELSASDVAGALELNLDDSGPRTPTPKPAAGKPAAGNDDPLLLGDDDVFVLAPEDTPKSASGRIAKPAAKSDSDVRLEKPGAKKPPVDDDQESILTEEIQIDLPASSKSGKLTGKSGRLVKGDSSGKLAGGHSGRVNPGASGTRLPSGAPSTGKMSSPPPEEDSSEFELSLEPSTESSDEFELSINADDSEDINLGEMPKQASGNSGINLHNPSDSGPSLEKKKGKKPNAPSDEEIDFELSLDSGSSKKIGGPKTSKAETDSDSEFELTLDDSSELGSNLNAETGSYPADEPKGDIFETDFEIPALDDASGSEVVALEDADTDLESSDFDLALDDSDVQAEDESGSEAIVVDDDAPAARRAPARRRRTADLEEDAGEVDLDDMGLDEGTSASAALRGVSRDDVEPDEDEEGGRVAVAAAPAEWGALPAVLLLPCVLIMFVGGLMGYEVLHSMWGYHQANPPASIVVNGVSDLFGMKPETGK